MYLILGKRGLACNQARQSLSKGGEGGPAIRPSFDSSDGRVENSPLEFTPRAEPQPATKPAKSRVEGEKGAGPFDPVSTAAMGKGVENSPLAICSAC